LEPLLHGCGECTRQNVSPFFSPPVYRLEEKEQEQKREYAKLHERYTELFKTHMDYMERTKILMGSADRLEGGARGRLPSLNLAQLNR